MVEIKIDTSKDSKEDIKKTIEFLKSFIGEQAEPVPVVEEGVFGIFDAPEEVKKDDDEYRNEEERDEDPDDEDVDIKPMFY